MTSSRSILSVILITIWLFLNETNAVFEGQDANPNEFTFAVLIRFVGPYSSFFCGGSIISPRHILTVAHCLNINETTASILSGVRNRHDLVNGIVTEVEKMIAHPDYQKDKKGHDVGILLLKEPLILGESQNKISLPTKPAEYDVYATFAGWGIATEKNPVFPAILQKASVILFACAWCDRGQELPACLCGTHESSGFCSGDSGSGLVAGGTIIGLAMENNCEDGHNDYYTSVYNHLEWINSIINQTN